MFLATPLRMIVGMQTEMRSPTVWILAILALFLGVLVGPVVGAEPEEALAEPSGEHGAESGAEDEAEEIREERYFRSKLSFWRVLRLPADLLDYVWYPLRVGLDYSEEIQLDERVEESFFFNDEHTAGWFPKPSFGGPLGDAGGVSVFFDEVFTERDRIDASVLVAGRREFEFDLQYAIVPNELEPFHLLFDVGFIRDREVEAFVTTDDSGELTMGMATDEDEESEYQLRQFVTSLDFGVELFAEVDLSCHVRGEVSKANQRPATTIAGFSGFNEEINLIAPGFLLEWDRRDDGRRPQRGWLIKGFGEVAASPVESDRDQRYGYTDYMFDAQAFIPLHGPHRVLVLRQRLRRVDDWAGYDLAFYHLPVLDLNHGLRAYERNRFRDNGSLVTNLEYRYPVWKSWDAYVFADGGQTFREYSDIDLSDFEYAVGGGVRLMTQKDIEFNLQVGFGSEDVEIVFSFDRVLQ